MSERCCGESRNGVFRNGKRCICPRWAVIYRGRTGRLGHAEIALVRAAKSQHVDAVGPRSTRRKSEHRIGPGRLGRNIHQGIEWVVDRQRLAPEGRRQGIAVWTVYARLPFKREGVGHALAQIGGEGIDVAGADKTGDRPLDVHLGTPVMRSRNVVLLHGEIVVAGAGGKGRRGDVVGARCGRAKAEVGTRTDTIVVIDTNLDAGAVVDAHDRVRQGIAKQRVAAQIDLIVARGERHLEPVRIAGSLDRIVDEATHGDRRKGRNVGRNYVHQDMLPRACSRDLERAPDCNHELICGRTERRLPTAGVWGNNEDVSSFKKMRQGGLRERAQDQVRSPNSLARRTRSPLRFVLVLP